MSPALKSLRENLGLPAQQTEEELLRDLELARQGLERLRQALVEVLPVAHPNDDDASLIEQVRCVVRDAVRQKHAEARREERARLAKEILLAAVPAIWEHDYEPKTQVDAAIELADALLAALDKPVQL